MLGGSNYTKVTLYDSNGDVDDYFTFTVREEDNLRVNFIREKECEDMIMDNGDIKRVWRGYRVHIEIDFLFDDWVSTTSNGGRTCQEFLQDLHNCTYDIKVMPHTDESSHEYLVLLENDWAFPYAFGRWKGWRGTLVFKGAEILSTIDLETPA